MYFVEKWNPAELFKDCSGFWYQAFTVKIRRNFVGEVKSECEAINGKTYFFRYGWKIEDDDGRYPGEIAWIPDDSRYPPDAPAWIASGDLEQNFKDHIIKADPML